MFKLKKKADKKRIRSHTSSRGTSVYDTESRTSDTVSIAGHSEVTVSGDCLEHGDVYCGEVQTLHITTPHSASAPSLVNPSGSASLGVNIQDPTGSALAVEEERRSSTEFLYHFTTQVTGEHRIMVCYNLMNIRGSPFKFEVLPAAVKPKTPPKSSSFSQETPLPEETALKPWQILSRDLKANVDRHLKRGAEITLGRELGQGHFGKVYEVRVTEPKVGAYLAAAKTITSSYISQKDLEEFLSEALLMSHFKHPNVLEMLGVVIMDQSPYILFPLMANQSLSEYLVKNKNQLDLRTMLSFGHQVSLGMTYISGIKFVHRDLAARNCLLSDRLELKISDFGLARDNFKSNYVMTSTQKRLPLRWMAPEIIETWTFTTETDVWSFGVLLWEIFTHGERPYDTLQDQGTLFGLIKAGTRLRKPDLATQEIYELMMRCWDIKPQERPDFREISREIEQCLDRAISYANMN